MSLCSKYYNKTIEFYTIVSKKKNLKNLTIFLLINFLFMFVEVFFGLLSNCLGLLTDGAHMLLDCSAVIIGLYSSYLSEFPSNQKYQFGFLRSEVLGTFINSVFLIFIAIYILFESMERFISPKDIHSENLILVSFLGLIVNIIGLFLAHDHGDDNDDENDEKSNSDDLINNENNNEILKINQNSNDNYLKENNKDNLKKKSEKKNDKSKLNKGKKHNYHHYHHLNEENKIENNDNNNEMNNESQTHIHNHHNHNHHHNDNLYAIYIHILADTLGSVAVLISSYLIRFHNIKISDPICSALISIMIVYSTIPVLKNSAVILLHIPNRDIKFRKEKIKEKCNEYNDSGFIIQSIDLWMLKKNHFVCDIKLIKNNNIVDNENTKLLYNDLRNLMQELKIKEFFIDI